MNSKTGEQTTDHVLYDCELVKQERDKLKAEILRSENWPVSKDTLTNKYTKQVDIPCDGILGRDFLQLAKAKLCYESRTVTEWGGMPNGRQDEATGVKQTNCEENGSD